MLCPKCEVSQDVLAYKVFEQATKYARALNVIVKCALCRHVFSPTWANEEQS